MSVTDDRSDTFEMMTEQERPSGCNGIDIYLRGIILVSLSSVVGDDGSKTPAEIWCDIEAVFFLFTFTMLR